MASREPRTSKVDWKIIIPWALTMLGLALGFVQYLQRADFDARKPFLEKQLTLVSDAVESVSGMATAGTPDVFNEQFAKFQKLYWGELSMVEDASVERWMRAAAHTLVTTGTQRPALATKLQPVSYCLAHAGRDLVLASWRVDMKSLARPVNAEGEKGNEPLTCPGLLAKIEDEIKANPNECFGDGKLPCLMVAPY